MTVDFTQPVLSMSDGSYVVTTKDPVYPYNVLPGDPLFLSIITWLNGQGNFATIYAPPDTPPLTDKQIEAQADAQVEREITASIMDKAKQDPEWVARKAELIAAKKGK